MVNRMNKARQLQFEKKMMTERGIPAQMIVKQHQPEPIWGFGSNKDKFKSGFGKEGSNIVVKSNHKDFGASQRIDKAQLVGQRY